MRPFVRTFVFLAAAFPAAALAQSPVIDEGVLIITRNGAPVGRESFRLQVAEGRFLTATGKAAHAGRQLAPALSVDSASGAPMLYRVDVRSADGGVERLQATGRPGRLSAVSHRSGGESAKEYVLGARPVILDEDVYHHYALLALLGRTGDVTVVVPRRSEQMQATIRARGTGAIRVDGQTVTANHIVIELPGGVHEMWVDRSGRLLMVAIPSRGIEVVREELPAR